MKLANRKIVHEKENKWSDKENRVIVEGNKTADLYVRPKLRHHVFHRVLYYLDHSIVDSIVNDVDRSVVDHHMVIICIVNYSVNRIVP